MKRSYESEEEREVKQIKLEEEILEELEESETYSSSSESDSDFGAFPPDSYVPVEEEDFVPDDIEKQVIRQSLSLISKSNMSDWSCETDRDNMILRGLSVVINNGDGICCDIIVEVSYHPLFTVSRIFYSLNKEERKIIYLKWETDFTGNYDTYDKITITKNVDKNVFLFFSKNVVQTSDFYPRDYEEEDWCYFADARSHIEKIRI